MYIYCIIIIIITSKNKHYNTCTCTCSTGYFAKSLGKKFSILIFFPDENTCTSVV